jgi:hypothetical protein
MAININAKTSGVGGLETTADNSGNINIQSGGSTVMSVTSSGVAVTGSFSQNGAVYSTQPSFRNLIINGDMRIDQRNAGTSYTSSNANVYTLDRWLTFETGGVSSRFTIQQNAGSVTPPTGFTNYMGITSSVASAVTAGMIQSIAQKIEGFNASDLAWGTANAKTVTISFWVRSSLTGTFGGVLSNGAVNYSYPFTYTISAANTWEYKTVTIAGPTAGTWVTNNGAGPVLQFVIGTGSTYQGSAGSWSANGYYGVTGTVDVTGTNGATLYITGVQLEVGSTATDFENLPYDVELARCQRYYWADLASQDNTNYHTFSSGDAGTTTRFFSYRTFPVPMRVIPSATISTAAGFAIYTRDAVKAVNSVNQNDTSPYGVGFYIDAPAASFTVGSGGRVVANNNQTASITYSAEL